MFSTNYAISKVYHTDPLNICHRPGWATDKSFNHAESCFQISIKKKAGTIYMINYSETRILADYTRA